MMKQLIFISISLLLICIGLQTVAATSDTAVPVQSTVVKPPDVGVPAYHSPPSIVGPVPQVAGPPVSRPAMSIVQSPVMSSTGSGQTTTEQGSSMNSTLNTSSESPEYAPDRVIVKFKPVLGSEKSTLSQVQAEAHAAMGATVLADSKTLGVEGMQVVRVPNSTGTMKAIGLYRMNPMVEYAQPDYLYQVYPVENVHIPVHVNQDAVSYRESLVQGKFVPSVGPSPAPAEENGHRPAPPSSVSAGAISVINESEEFGYMRLSLEDIAQIQSDYNAAVKVENAPLSSIQGSKSLLSNIQYTPSERNQGNCGNCWVWASTGVIENALTVQNGIKNRLSIQYFDSNYNGGSATTGACNGGWASTFANFHSTTGFKQVIPWSNTNAYYNDRYACNYGCGAQTPASSIATSPNYPITSISTSWITTTGVSQAQAIANIKAQIDANKAVWWAFFLPDSSSWSAFNSFWAYQTESALWNPDSYNNMVYGSSGGGHAVIIVGYDDTSSDPNQRYWIVLNSWGSNSNRPYGLFRLKMNMDYGGKSSQGYQNHYFAIFNVNYGIAAQTGSISVSSTPSGAQIWLDGTNTGKVTPNTLTSVTAASHAVTLKLTGYTDYSTSVTVPSGGTATVSATLTAVPKGSISIGSNPTGASVYLDSEAKGVTTPTTLSNVATGTHTVRLSKSGYQDWSQSVSVTADQTTTVSATMTAVTPGSLVIPNDPSFSSLYGLHNTGQTGGTADADIDAPEAWAYVTGSSDVIVAVVDTGVDYNHPDLAANMIAGYDTRNNDSDPMDDHGHGTHCAGTIGAVGNNGIGVTGVNWNVKIMPLKFLSSSGSGYTSDAIEAFAWGYSHGARIFSNSWGASGIDTALRDSISSMPDALFVCAAGNSALNTDTNPHSPGSLPNANILTVAATDSRDALASFSNYGATTVDVAAPGVNIYSTYPGNRYTTMSGTSMATPHVAGVAGLLKAANPSMTMDQIKTAIMNGVDVKSGLSGRCVTGGRINAYTSVRAVSQIIPKFYGVPETVVYPLTIRFYDVSEGFVTSRTWNFGDGNTSTVQNPVHTFYNPQTYTVTLQVSNAAQGVSAVTNEVSP
ncbi:S8 family serine peptidase [Methanospirillum hungatei]|uniref:S8 family serine peptidase n=1 Tax=Methanospirillum hungatei TaxID=2203 RepID=UPI0026EEACE3|nr:S8 family serine peptidase [Methanospirillum hungatei]MCA1917432.1 S8 family serine peptidase [Methanospirillum hungatei]